MDLQTLRKNWNQLAESDPMWAVLSDPSKLGHHWDQAEFFETGAAEIRAVMHTADERFPALRRGRALDFGCGLGRLSRALSSYFESVTGVDIADSMVRQATELNSEFANCTFVVNASDDLKIFSDGSFDFIYSDIVLQHMQPRFASAYIREFARIASPRGVIVFRLPDSHALSIVKRLKAAIVPLIPYIPPFLTDAYLRRHYPNAPAAMLKSIREHPMELHGAKKRDVLSLLDRIDAPAEYVEEDVGEGWRSFRYFAQKR